MNTPLETFRLAQDRLFSDAGLTPREIREGRSRLAACDATRAVERHEAGCLLLLGDPGTGKSVASARWLMTEGLALSRWFGIGGVDRFVWKYKGGRLLWRTAKSLSRVQQYDSDDMERLLLPDRLVIDDIGMEYLDAKGFLVSLIDEIVHERHRRELPTVMTANLSPAEFVGRYGQRVLDRMSEYQPPAVCARASFRTSPAQASERQLPELAADAEVIARHAEVVAAEEARTRRQAEEWERQRAERDAERAANVQPIRREKSADDIAREQADAARAAEAIRKLRERVANGGT